VTGLAAAALIAGGTAATASAARPSIEPPAPLVGTSAAEKVAGEYMVVLKDQAGLRAAGVKTASDKNQVKSAADRGRKLGAGVERRYSRAIQGYSAKLSASELAAVRKDPAVAYVQPNLTYKATGVTQKNPPSWGLDRIDQRKLPLDKAYYQTATGKGVSAFIVDTGLSADNPDFAGRVGAGVSFVDDGNGSGDCDGVLPSDGQAGEGHGTHVAGTIGGTDFGVAKEVTLVPVRVLGCNGMADTATIVAGLDWILEHGGAGPKVVNMSLGGDGTDAILESAVKRLITAGITVVISAGNGDENGNGQSACGVSPARVPTAITVGATTKKDARATFSNFGKCVDLYAPGVGITSDWVHDEAGDWYIAELDGTSMAAPHVTGTVAMYLQRHPTATPAQVSAALTKAATPNQVSNLSSKFSRLLLLGVQKAVVPASVASGNRLASGKSLTRGHKLCSSNGKFCLAPETTGKLVLRNAKAKAVWTGGSGVFWASMTKAGAFSGYDDFGHRKFTSATTGGPNTLFVNSNGYLAVLRDSDKKVLWTSKD
jgi:subtilisin family serine protease